MDQELVAINAELQMLAQDEQEQILDAMFAEYLQAMLTLCYSEIDANDTFNYA